MFGHRHEFIALLDPDEYIIMKEPPQPPFTRPHLPTFLGPFEAYGGITVYWQLVGPSGHVDRPKDSTMTSYTKCMPREALQVGAETVCCPRLRAPPFRTPLELSLRQRAGQGELDGRSAMLSVVSHLFPSLPRLLTRGSHCPTMA
jgi:hypothetical protein